MENKREMTMEREARILEGAVEKYGAAAQTDVAIEEMAELTKALLKWRRAATIDGELPRDCALACLTEKRDAVLEEMADVQIMLNQMALIYGDFNEQEIAKLERLEAKLQKT